MLQKIYCSFICEKQIDSLKNEGALACGHFICEKCKNLYEILARKNNFQSLICPSSDCEKEVFQNCSGNCGRICQRKNLNEKMEIYCEECLLKNKKTYNTNFLQQNLLATHLKTSNSKDISKQNKEEILEKGKVFGDEEILKSDMTHECGNIIFKETITHSIVKRIESREKEYLKCDKCSKKIGFSFLKQLIPKELYFKYIQIFLKSQKLEGTPLNLKFENKDIVQSSLQNKNNRRENLNIDDEKSTFKNETQEEKVEKYNEKNSSSFNYYIKRRPQTSKPEVNKQILNENPDPKFFLDDYLFCYICYKRKNSKDFLFLDCSHAFCSNCLKKDWQTKIISNKLNENSIFCLICPRAISYNFLKANLDSQQFAEYDNLLAQSCIYANTQNVYCPQKECLSLNIADKKLSYINCEKCNFKFCITCRQEWDKHLGYTCNEFKLNLDYQNLREKNKFKIIEESKTSATETLNENFPTNKIEQNKNFFYNKTSYSYMMRPKNYKAPENVKQEKKKEYMHSILSNNRKTICSYSKETSLTIQKKESKEKCKICGRMLYSHFSHSCGKILCDEIIAQMIKQIIDLNLNIRVECEGCFKEVEIDLLKQIIPENLFLQYRDKMTNFQLKNEYIVRNCPNSFCKNKIQSLTNDFSLFCNECRYSQCLICKKKYLKNHTCFMLTNNLENPQTKTNSNYNLTNNFQKKCNICAMNNINLKLEEILNGTFLFCSKHNKVICKLCGDVLYPSNVEVHLKYKHKK